MFSWTEASHESAARVSSSNIASDCAVCSARSTVAKRSSIRVPVNMFEYSDLISGCGLVLFFLSRSGKNSTTELRFVFSDSPLFPKLFPGALYSRRTGSPAVSPDDFKLAFDGWLGDDVRRSILLLNLSPALVAP